MDQYKFIDFKPSFGYILNLQNFTGLYLFDFFASEVQFELIFEGTKGGE